MKITVSSAGIAALMSSMLIACGGGGGGGSNPPPPPPPPPPADTTAPVTAVNTTSPAQTASNTITFTFSANETSTFESRLDGAAFAAATSPQLIDNLGEGSHTFEVRARDAAGNTDATPASFTWVVDSTPPDTTITAAPSSTAVVNSATFTVTSTEMGGTFEASVDGAQFAAVTVPYTVGSLADGPHSIQFRARDAAGNVDATPATASWTLDATPAQVGLLFPMRNFYTDATTVYVRGTAQDTHGVTAVSVNGVAAQSTDGFAHWSAVIPVPVGTTPVSISSTDGPGNAAAIALATMMNRGPFVHIGRSVGFDAARNRVIVNDQGTGNIIAIRRSDGIGTLLSPGPAQGTTPGNGYEAMVIDAANDRAIILNGADGVLIGVNLTTGVRTVISPSGSSPTQITGSYCLTLDAPNQRVYVSAGNVASVVRINLATGTRTVVSSDTVGTGASLINPRGIVLDNVTNPGAPRLLVVVSPLGVSSILAVDLATGNRTPFTSASVGTGPILDGPESMVLDTAGQRVIVSNLNNGTLTGVALATGNRSTVWGGGVGTGAFMYFGVGISFDPTNRILFVPNIGGFGEVDVVSQVSRIVAQQDVGTGDRILSPDALIVEQATGTPTSLLYVHGSLGNLYRLDLATSNRTPITGPGPSLYRAVGLALDTRPAANGRAVLVLVAGSTPALVSVDLVTGARTLVTNITSSAFENRPVSMALDVASNRVLFTNDETMGGNVDQLFALNLANGTITAISDASNTGPTFAAPGSMVLDPATNPTRAIVADPFAMQFLSINLATGDRSTFDSSGGGAGVMYTRTGPMVMDTTRADLLVNHVNYPSNIFTIPLGPAVREIVSGANPATLAVRGTGPPLFWVTAMDADFEARVIYEASSNNASIFAVDMVSGDRVVLAH